MSIEDEGRRAASHDEYLSARSWNVENNASSRGPGPGNGGSSQSFVTAVREGLKMAGGRPFIGKGVRTPDNSMQRTALRASADAER